MTRANWVQATPDSALVFIVAPVLGAPDPEPSATLTRNSHESNIA